MTLELSTPLEQVKGVGPAYAALFGSRGLNTVLDLLLHFPVYYMDFSAPSPRICPGERRAYRVDVTRVKLSRHFPRRLSLLRVRGRVGGAAVEILFFNKPYLADQLQSGGSLAVFGTFVEKEGRWEMLNPQTPNLEKGETIVPVYPALGSLKSGHLRNLMTEIFRRLADSWEPLPEHLRQRHRFRSVADSLRAIHQPERLDDRHLEKQRQRFSYNEFLFFQLELQAIRRFFSQRQRLHTYRFTAGLRSSIEQRLPFRLSEEQIRAFSDIVNDLLAPRPMQRLLQGEVGSGKTIVAFLALLLACENGYQGAFLAPTEILAGQHCAAASSFFHDRPIALLTGSTPAEERAAICRQLEQGEIAVLFGTHALLQQRVRFKNLALIVIDEQHRFGVAQRAALYYKGSSVDLLVTTATPIPRTLLLGLYNDLAVSTLRQKPASRQPVTTRLILPPRRDAFYLWLRRHMEKGEKGYLILPLIEKSEHFPELLSIGEEKARFQALFKGIPMAVITGRHGPREKETALEAFRAGRVRLLLATSVIEVGIDVSDATFIVVENADRYGLAQLHQLRGRVGRGEKASRCFLIPSGNVSDSGRARLQAMTETDDGFKIAELDLKLRGGGDITGLQQAGSFDFRSADLQRDYPLFRAAQKDAAQLLEQPSLQNEAVTALLAALEKKLRSLSFS